MESPCAWILHARIFLIRWDVHDKKRHCTGTPRPSRDRAACDAMLVAWERKTKCNRSGLARASARIARMPGASNPTAERYFICASWQRWTRRIENIRRYQCCAARATSRKPDARIRRTGARLKFAEQAVGRDFIWP